MLSAPFPCIAPKVFEKMKILLFIFSYLVHVITFVLLIGADIWNAENVLLQALKTCCSP